jgi:hypothetical protein
VSLLGLLVHMCLGRAIIGMTVITLRVLEFISDLSVFRVPQTYRIGKTIQEIC